MNELTINQDSRSKMPLYEQIYDLIKSDIQNGRLRYGEKLPSTRALAKHLEVSRSTVELAYEQLLSVGYIESAPYRGFFVAQIDELYQLKKEEKKPERKRKKKIICLLRCQVASSKELQSPELWQITRVSCFAMHRLVIWTQPQPLRLWGY